MRFTEQKFRTIGILGSLLVLIIGVTLRFKVLGIYPKRNFVERLGYNVFRGSSEDRGLGTLRGLLNLKSIIAITPDGPKGERCKLKDGSKCVLNISPPIDPHKIEKSSLEVLFIKIDNEAEELVKCL
ncbi:DUF374 domain-containing protein [candidate division WOR-3 bacterium]|nr:DUF374 domain-containing protein [candidate division WOR-3 bacterium]